MDNSKVCRMSLLFEKAVSQSASQQEQFELKSLYEEFICEGRSKDAPKMSRIKPHYLRAVH